MATSGLIKLDSLGSTPKARSIPQRHSYDVISLPAATQGSVKSDFQGTTSKLQAYRRDTPAKWHRSQRQHEVRSSRTPKVASQSIEHAAEIHLRGRDTLSGNIRFDRVELPRQHLSDSSTPPRYSYDIVSLPPATRDLIDSNS